MSLLLASELSAAKLHAAASNDVFEGLSEQDSKLAQVGAHGWSALSTPWFWVGHSRPNEQAKVEELTRQMLHSEPAERISVTDALVLCSAATSNIKNACFGANCADSDGRGGGIFCGSNPLI